MIRSPFRLLGILVVILAIAGGALLFLQDDVGLLTKRRRDRAIERCVLHAMRAVRDDGEVATLELVLALRAAGLSARKRGNQ